MDIQFDVEDVFDPENYLFFYQATFTQERLATEVDFLVEHTQLKGPKKILDLAWDMAGTQMR